MYFTQYKKKKKKKKEQDRVNFCNDGVGKISIMDNEITPMKIIIYIYIISVM